MTVSATTTDSKPCSSKCNLLEHRRDKNPGSGLERAAHLFRKLWNRDLGRTDIIDLHTYCYSDDGPEYHAQLSFLPQFFAFGSFSQVVHRSRKSQEPGKECEGRKSHAYSQNSASKIETEASGKVRYRRNCRFHRFSVGPTPIRVGVHVFAVSCGLSSIKIRCMEKSDNSSASFESGDACSAAAEYGIDLARLDANLARTPLERLILHDQALHAALAIKDAGIRYYGFDPGPAEAVERT